MGISSQYGGRASAPVPPLPCPPPPLSPRISPSQPTPGHGLPSRSVCATSEPLARSVMVELAALCRRHGPASRALCGPRMPPRPLAAMQAMAPCRPEALGGPVSPGTACEALAYRSPACTPRHGPTGQHHAATRWLDPQRPRLLPGPSFLGPLTLPEARQPFARSRPKRLDNLRLHLSAATWQARA